MTRVLRKPEWLRTKIPSGANFETINKYRTNSGLATVCEEAKCPNQWECWKSGTATFMLMGDTCTRACRFCSVSSSKKPLPLDQEEPQKLSETVQKLNLKYAVLTTVDRDDLPDFGAAHIKQCVDEIKRRSPDIIIELLAPDFQGDRKCIKIISGSKADVLGHNIECVRKITPKVRDPRASYDQSLGVLSAFKQENPAIITKSSIMVGLGESKAEVIETMRDLRDNGVEILTIGQYLQPTRHKLPVEAYITPAEFEEYEKEARKIGFDFVASGPLVRSSYKAVEHYLAYKLSASPD